jgi:rubrerythrin
MNVFDFAMKMEVDGKAYYEKLAKKTDLAGLKTIFTRLAEDEQKHYDIFQELKAGAKAPAMPETTILNEAKNIFEELPKGAPALKDLAGDLEAYQHAMKLETDSFRLYEDAAAKEKDPGVKALLLKIAGEEHKHFNVLGNIFHFVNAPNQFLAWREFSNLDEFHQFGRDVDR